ncbi:phenylethanolamine N-methyltransferase [Lepeophtheirus salmonis]|uniref:phenylethanolamine N-methyltransferase n=1 Tax=Lepeophtheirus salmonis TaxID=72036 RepID=UPI001AE8AB30|nr:phenylethanolamine N-methyltransferase-like [Lepeophtheirus salmonis]
MTSNSDLRSLHSKIDSYYAKGYLDTWCGNVRKEWSEFLNRFFTILTKEFFKELKDEPRVLDIGCGPSISNIIAASSWSSHIILADFLESNRVEVRGFWRGPDDEYSYCFNWNHHFKFNGVLELNPNISDIESRTRNAIRGVYFCDVLNDESMFLVEDSKVINQDSRIKADVVIASLVLDVVALNHKTFLRALINVSKCLKPNGIILLQGSLGESIYTVGSAVFPVMNIDELGLKKIFHEASMNVLKWETTTHITTHYFAVLRMK